MIGSELRSMYAQIMEDGPDVPYAYLEHRGISPQDYFDELSPDILAAERFEITNVAEYFWMSEKSRWYWDKDIPNSAPVFPVMWFEYDMPPMIHTQDGYVPNPSKGDEPKFGVLVKAWQVTDEVVSSVNKVLEANSKPAIARADVHWLISIRGFVGRSGKRVIGPVGDSVVLLDETGRALCSPVATANRDFHVIAENFGMRMYPAGLALSFLHCKNVVVGTRFQNISRQARRQMQRTGGFINPTFKTLEIEPMRKVLETEGGIAHNGLKKALHICRGHFSEYSEEKPLFGKYSGRFWIPSHVRGSAESGRVVKDYKVKAPKTEAA